MNAFNVLMNRRSIRHHLHDYHKAGAYFLTICTQNGKHIFGTIINSAVELNDAGRMIVSCWEAIPQKYSSVALDSYVVMPNHFHAVLVLGMKCNDGKWLYETDDNPLVGEVVGAFKSTTTALYAKGVRSHAWPPFDTRLWQRNYYERVIRNDHEFCMIKEYIRTNPERWHNDRENELKEGTDEFDIWLDSL